MLTLCYVPGDLESSYMKRAPVRKDAEYMYMCHHMTSMTVTPTQRKTYYDDVLWQHHQQHDLELVEKYYGANSRESQLLLRSFSTESIKNYQKHLGHRKPGEKLVADWSFSWQYDNFDGQLPDGPLEQLMGRGWLGSARNPEYLKRYPARME